MGYKALYREYRPQTFDEVVGQKYIVQTLKNEIAQGKVNHAYLFTGPRGTGKTTIAKLIAKGLNCTGFEKPCGECENCKAIARGTYPDVIEMDAASNNGVDEVRNLIEKVRYTPIEGKYKVYIIDEVHMMTGSAFNALLKTLEEPPENVVFILATTEVNKVPATILSRCQRFDFGRISQKDLEKKLKEVLEKENISYEDGVVSLIAALADGGVRDALGILDQTIAYVNNNITEQDVRDIYGVLSTQEAIEFIRLVNNHSVTEALKELDKFDQKGVDIPRFTTMLIDILKEVIVFNKTSSEENLQLLNDENIYEIADFIDSKTAFAYIDILLEAANSYSKVNTPRSYFELAILKLCDVESMPEQKVVYVEKKQPEIKVEEKVEQPVYEEKIEEPIKEEPSFTQPSFFDNQEEVVEEEEREEQVQEEPIQEEAEEINDSPVPSEFSTKPVETVEDDEEEEEEHYTVADLIDELGAIDYDLANDWRGYEVYIPIYDEPFNEDKTIILVKDGNARFSTHLESNQYYDDIEGVNEEPSYEVEEEQEENVQPVISQPEPLIQQAESEDETDEDDSIFGEDNNTEDISVEEEPEESPVLETAEEVEEVETEEEVVEEEVSEEPSFAQPTFEEEKEETVIEEVKAEEPIIQHVEEKVQTLNVSPAKITRDMIINYLVQSNKDSRLQLANIWNSLHKYINIPKYSRAANCLRDGSIVAASEEAILISMDTKSEADIANSPEMYLENKALIAELFGKEYKYIATDTNEFRDIRVYFKTLYDNHELPMPQPIKDIYDLGSLSSVKTVEEKEEDKVEEDALSIFGDMLNIK